MSVIRVAGVTKDYFIGRNRVHALRGIDLAVEPGEMLAVMGASGSGKSTLMNILGCLDAPTGGDYFLDGTRVNDLDGNALADLRNRKLGFVFQGFNLLSRTTALENVELPLLYDRSGQQRDTRALAHEALKQVGLGDRARAPAKRALGWPAAARRHRACAGDAAHVCCWLMSPPAISTATPPWRSWRCSRNSTIRESRFSSSRTSRTSPPTRKRIVEVRDGRIIRDESVAERHRARGGSAQHPGSRRMRRAR